MSDKEIPMDYMKTPLHRFTFRSKKIRNWVIENCEGLVLNLYGGPTRLEGINEISNDIGTEFNTNYHKDALQFVEEWDGDKFNTVVLDPPYCYDEQTEVLTDVGWKFFKDLNGSEKIATLNTETGYAEYHSPTDYIKQKYCGDMIKVKSGSIDLLVTPNHKLYIRKIWKTNSYKLVPAEELNYGCKFKCDFLWDGEDKEYFLLPSVSFDRSDLYNNTEAPEKKISMDIWLQFFGLWLSDGCADSAGTDYRVRIVCKKERKRLAVKKTLNSLGYNYIEESNGYTIYNKQLCSYLGLFGKASDKYVPFELKQLSRRQLNIFIDYYAVGDDHKRLKLRYHEKYNKYYTDTCFTCSSVSKRMTDDFYEIGVKAGYICTVIPNKKEGYKNSYLLNFGHHRKTPTIVKKRLNDYVKREPYKGYIYCVTVPNNIVYVRRNKDACWCGNSERKCMEMYKGRMSSPFNSLKDAIPNILTDNGLVITFGYYSVSMGQKRNFYQERILLMSHGGAIHDTIATKERRRLN